MKRVVFAFSAMLASVTPTLAQQVVFTNVVNGQRTDAIVKVVRIVTPAAPVPSSIVTTEVLPRNYRPPIGARSYSPPIARAAAASSSSRPAPAAQPWFVNGVYVGSSPNGNWMSTSIGRPIVDVNVISTPAQRHTFSRSKQENDR